MNTQTTELSDFRLAIGFLVGTVVDIADAVVRGAREVERYAAATKTDRVV